MSKYDYSAYQQIMQQKIRNRLDASRFLRILEKMLRNMQGLAAGFVFDILAGFGYNIIMSFHIEFRTSNMTSFLYSHASSPALQCGVNPMLKHGDLTNAPAETTNMKNMVNNQYEE